MMKANKFLLRKRFKLNFLGDEWKDAYLDFNRFTLDDLQNKLPQLSTLDVDETTTDGKKISEATDTMIGLLGDKFIGGKGVGEDKEVVDIEKLDLKYLPIEVIAKAINFLSQDFQQGLAGPSENSSQPKDQLET